LYKVSIIIIVFFNNRMSIKIVIRWMLNKTREL